LAIVSQFLPVNADFLQQPDILISSRAIGEQDQRVHPHQAFLY